MAVRTLNLAAAAALPSSPALRVPWSSLCRSQPPVIACCRSQWTRACSRLGSAVGASPSSNRARAQTQPLIDPLCLRFGTGSAPQVPLRRLLLPRRGQQPTLRRGGPLDVLGPHSCPRSFQVATWSANDYVAIPAATTSSGCWDQRHSGNGLEGWVRRSRSDTCPRCSFPRSLFPALSGHLGRISSPSARILPTQSVALGNCRGRRRGRGAVIKPVVDSSSRTHRAVGDRRRRRWESGCAIEATGTGRVGNYTSSRWFETRKQRQQELRRSPADCYRHVSTSPSTMASAKLERGEGDDGGKQGESDLRLSAAEGEKELSALEQKKANRLVDEQSPYLLQHAYNPVDWYPWGEEAFAKARSENRPIFLSVGYSTCHWCHVMEVESFESEEVAKLMNDWFVNIKCHVSSATSETVPRQQYPATMTGAALGMSGQLANESIADYKKRFQAQLAAIEAEEQRQLAVKAAQLQAEVATAEKLQLQAEADADTQARRKEAQDLLLQHEANSIDRFKFWHFEPNGDEPTPEEKHKEFMAKLVTRLVCTCNHLQSELANLQRVVRNRKTQHEDATRALDARVLDLEQAVPGPAAGASSSASSSHQLEECVDHVVAMLGDISDFTEPATISQRFELLDTKISQQQQTDHSHNNSSARPYKMPTALFINTKGGCQIWLSHMATIHGVQVSDLHKVSWADMAKEWKKRFIVDDAPALAINRIFAMAQGSTPIRDWLTDWQKIVATPDLDLPFPHLRREFYNRSCAALSLALGDHEQYHTSAEIINKAREIIKTNSGCRTIAERLPKPHCNVLMAQLRDYLHTAVPAPLMDSRAEVVDLLAYIAKIDREFKTQRYDDIDAPLLYIRIQIGEATCNALIDCGASHNYISQDFMVRAGLGPRVRRKSQPTQVTLVDGHTHKSIDRCIDAVPVYFAPHASEAVSFDILDTKFDMMLGMSWLRSEDHPVNFFKCTVHIRDRNGVLVPCTVPLPHPSINCHVVSAASMPAWSSTGSAHPPRDHRRERGRTSARLQLPNERGRSVLRAQLDELLEKGWIRPSSSPYGAPVLFVRKKNKDLLVCIDYRKLNAQTIRNAGPLPRIDDLLERLGGALFFSKLDLKSGYHQLEIRKEDRYKTAFKTRYGHFEWLVMLFGLTKAPTTFQAAMTTEFRHMLDRFVLIYLDDILVYSRSLNEHVEHLRTVLKRLRQAKYKANRDKCEFAQQELEYLGHYVTPQGIRPLADKIEALRVWPEPTNITDVRSFMGLAGYYQRFITGYSRIAAPMTRLKSPKVPFVFDDAARRSFQALKTAMLMAPVLSIYDPTLPTRVTTDASGYGIGAVLEQHDGDDWHPVEYFSHKVPPINSLDDARKELLAFVMALKRWRHFLLGRRRFTWVTDNNPLTYYKTQDTVSSTIGRWMYFIDQFDFTPKHLPGLSNRAADALSRRPDLCAMTHHAFAFDEELQRHFILAYQSDPDFGTLYAQLSSDHPPASHYRIADGYLLLHSRCKDLLCVPRDRHLRTRLHDSRLTGHFGVNRTIARLRQRFRWPDLITDVTRYCDSCEVCRRSKPRNRNPYGELHPMPIPREPGLSIAMDVTGPFPRDRLGHDGILTVVDRLSKYARFLPCKYYSMAPELARLLHTGWICGYGVDREERPDVDKVYMTYVQAMQGSGGWPMSVFLTPDLKPIVGGTYFPPNDMYGRLGFKTVLRRVKEAWEKSPDKLREGGDQAIQQLAEATSVWAEARDMANEDALEAIQLCVSQLASKYDGRLGGFGGAPKFPRPSEINILLRRHLRLAQRGDVKQSADRVLGMASFTLKCMSRGGMHDHIGGGFHRYSVDEYWHVPHFEKMLYDQGQLANAYLDAFLITSDTHFATMARDVLDYLRREMTYPGGGFFSAEDADSAEYEGGPKREGAFYAWTTDELEDILGSERFKVFASHYYVKEDGNCDLSKRSDPHDEFKGKNVLIERSSLAETAAKFGLPENKCAELLGQCRLELHLHRKKRPHPHLDDKIIVAWNGLAISAMARASRVLRSEPVEMKHHFPVEGCNPAEYLKAAENAASFLEEKLYDPSTKRLRRNYRNLPSEALGFIDDYAFLIGGLIDLYEAGGDIRWLTWALELQNTQDELFLDKEGGGYFSVPEGDSTILLRMKEDYDGAEPSGNSVAATNLLRLSAMLYGTRAENYRSTAEHVMAVFASRLKDIPMALPQLCCALDLHTSNIKRQIIVAGVKGRRDAELLTNCAHSTFEPDSVVLFVDDEDENVRAFWHEHNPNVLAMAKKLDGKAAAYICQNFVCKAPVTDPESMGKILREPPAPAFKLSTLDIQSAMDQATRPVS
ncbi:hypothetical protein CBR_g39419 [Chara braunii]|uniref:Reverse transcriptase domain-containing protein n=1 Tax=Chara braunii TaxID=69332 RepID=A0A388LRJ8_CHABU|nr:hypothetical protein CBR_g39419 [Chara braunii]|eukprot:GBG84956.1 hypothetical protein CBR_g39419 [Chara braunii]